MKAPFVLFLITLGCAFGQVPSSITNGGFESGALAPWVLAGAGAAVSNGVFSPAIAAPHGRFMGYITTLNNEGAKDFGYFNESPDIDSNGVKESEYSSLSITFTAAVPSRVSVHLNLLTDEIVAGTPASVNDADVWGVTSGSVSNGPFVLLLALATTSGSYTGTARRLPPEAFAGGEIVENNFGVYPTIPDASRFQGQTGFTNYFFQVSPGVHTWTFFVADSRTDGVASAMLMDAFEVTPMAEKGETVVRVADINPGSRGSYPSFLTVYRNQLYFRANSGINDTELWRFDGTNAWRVADIVPGSDGSSPANLAVLNDRLFFNATTAAGYRVWQFDGIHLARVTNANPPYAFFDGGSWKPVVWFGELYYPSQGRIYRFNGERFASLNTPPFAGTDLTLWNGWLFYGAQESSYGVELWRFDGNAQTRVSDINSGAGDASPEGIYATPDGLYFGARTAPHGMELYRYNGASPRRLVDINPGPADSYPHEFCAFGRDIYFSADDGTNGFELWRSDGTNAFLVANVNPHPVYEEGGDRLTDSHPRHLTVWQGKLYFSANSGTRRGLWSCDGTNVSLVGGGTANADDSSDGVSELIVFQDRLYFDADDGIGGRELWRVEPNPDRMLSLKIQGSATEVALTEAETGVYVLEATTDFATWVPVATNSVRDGRVLTLDTNGTGDSTRFYRAVPMR